MLSEIKVALRGLAESPGFTAIAIATLAQMASALPVICVRATRADPMIALGHNA